MPQLRYFLKGALILIPLSIIIGSVCAFFLWSLEALTLLRWEQPWLLYFLPLGGWLVGLLYQHYGQSVVAGNNLIVEQIHQPGGGIPKRMAPLVLMGTLITHLCGGSAGREGTAVQMGGSIASAMASPFKLEGRALQTFLMAGVAAGFGAVFGTPVAGAVFAIEVVAIGQLNYKNLLPCLMAAFVGNGACAWWGIHHTSYAIHSTAPTFQADPFFGAKVILAAMAFGWASRLFSELAHGVQRGFAWLIPVASLRPVLGGVVVIGLVATLGTQDYLGLGVTAPQPDGISIVQALSGQWVDPWGWWWKLLFTAVTIGSGFKGGEVTPLFFMGAALGNALGWFLGAPPDLLAALGLVAIFAGAANTPIACTLLGMELFGAENAGYFALACLIAYLFSGHTGIYLSQILIRSKLGGPNLPQHTTLRMARQHQNSRWKTQWASRWGRIQALLTRRIKP
ncbi:voltage-gated chloride channel family protein [Vampirovibrio sp.]|uniref:voltage-gated chloride channel family protein n=1 Tax=Vampirovibrio sp. TaxID=2717857 RepID=UPI00359349DC